MRIDEFAQTYCQDLLELYKDKKSILDDYDLPYDDIIDDDEGTPIKVVYVGTKAIPITDIVSCTRDDFAQLYPDFESRELYDRYIDQLTIFEGEEAVMHIRNTMKREQERVKAFGDDNDLSEMV